MSIKKPPDNIVRIQAKIEQIADVIAENGKMKNKPTSASKPKQKVNPKCGQKGKTDMESTKALENVVLDMTNILQDLRSIKKISRQLEKKYSPNTIENDLEIAYQKQKKIEKENEAKKLQEELKLNEAKIKNNINNNNKNNNNNSNNTANKTEGNKPKQNNVENNKIIKIKPKSSKDSRLGETKRSSEPQKTINTNTKVNQPKLLQKNTSYLRKNVIPMEVYNPLGLMKADVAVAMADRKTFSVRGYYPVIRKALVNRGWIEKFTQHYRGQPNDDIKKFVIYSIPELLELLRNKEVAEVCKAIIKSKLLAEHQVDLYWDHTYDAYKECPDTKKLTLINRIRRLGPSFTSKQGLCETVKDWLWLEIPNLAGIRHPKAYILAKGGDTKEFVKDFGLTAAISLLKWIVYNDSTKECRIVSHSGKVSLKYFEFAITECYKFIKTKKHQDIDESICEASEKEWNEFVDQFNKIIHIGNHFKLTSTNDVAEIVSNDMVKKSIYILGILKNHLPYMHMDGMMNIWILKPSAASQGKGIHICRNLSFIFTVIRNNPTRRYIVQKYVEKPLLIRNTKFDIRQWFLLSSTSPMTVWIYKSCYLRFSSQTYNLRNLHESVHLTNNSVQCNYLQSAVKDPIIPKYCMWDSKQFQNYLSDIGYPEVYQEIIYKGMKECLTAAMISHSDKVDKRKNSFELYGADFILDEYFQPWLLEINSHPALQPSTPVTARMCPEVLEDVIKVVVDWARNKNAKTGNFELIFEENKIEEDAKLKLQLSGKPLTDDYFYTPSKMQMSNQSVVKKVIEECRPEHRKELMLTPVYTKEVQPLDTNKFLQKTGEAMRVALKNLMELVRTEKQRRSKKREVSVKAMSIVDMTSTTQTSLESATR